MAPLAEGVARVRKPSSCIGATTAAAGAISVPHGRIAPHPARSRVVYSTESAYHFIEVAIRGDTRYLLQRGLATRRLTARLGLQAMMRTAGLNPAWLSEEHIGFVLGPRVNAGGRIGKADLGARCLSTVDADEARALWFSALGVPVYVSGMMVAAFALRGGIV